MGLVQLQIRQLRADTLAGPGRKTAGFCRVSDRSWWHFPWHVAGGVEVPPRETTAEHQRRGCGRPCREPAKPDRAGPAGPHVAPAALGQRRAPHRESCGRLRPRHDRPPGRTCHVCPSGHIAKRRECPEYEVQVEFPFASVETGTSPATYDRGRCRSCEETMSKE